MGRRVSEPEHVHRQRISSAAHDLFAVRGIGATSMDDVARAAGYSKATLYVYFANKEEIVGLLTLRSMEKLYSYLVSALAGSRDTKKRYDGICGALVCYQEAYPFYFGLALGRIDTAFNEGECLREERETYRVGERINAQMVRFVTEGKEAGAIRPDIEAVPTVLAFWAMLSGFVRMAADKETYLSHATGMTREGYLRYGFDLLYRSIIP